MEVQTWNILPYFLRICFEFTTSLFHAKLFVGKLTKYGKYSRLKSNNENKTEAVLQKFFQIYKIKWEREVKGHSLPKTVIYL